MANFNEQIGGIQHALPTNNLFSNTAISLPLKIHTRELNDKTYYQWANGVKHFFAELGKLHHLTDDPPSSELCSYDLWLRQDALLMLALSDSMEPQISKLCRYKRTCKKIWDFVRGLYENLNHKYIIFTEWCLLEQGNRSIGEYTQQFMLLADEMRAFWPPSTDPAVQKNQNIEMIGLKFLNGLDPELESVRSQILQGTEVPVLHEIYARCLRFKDA